MAKSTAMVQVDLESRTSGRQMTTWVEKKDLIVEGSRVRLDGDEEWLKIIKVYDLEVPKDQLGLRGFSNNI